MNFGKIFAGIIFTIALAINFTGNAEPVASQQPQSANLSDMTSENSGLNPGYTVKQMQNPRPVSPGDKLPQVTATSAIVIEASTGHVIYERNADKRMFPASTTKMMTLIMALENGKLDDIVTVSDNAFGTEGSTLWLDTKDKIPLGEMLFGMILVSGNDAAIAVAEHIDGSVAKFAQHMTQRARELGATGTNFANAHGLPDENHYTTARDLALIAAHGYTLDHFEEIVSVQEKTFPWIHDENKLLRTENQLLWLYRGGNGVKTGYTDVAGRCLVSAAKRDGIQVIAVVLDSVYMWNDSIMLLDYAFDHIQTETLIKDGEILRTVPIISGRKNSMPVKAASKISVPVFKGQDAYEIDYDIPSFLDAPVKNGEVIGKIHVMCDGKEITSTDVLATDDVEKKSFFLWLISVIKNWFS